MGNQHPSPNHSNVQNLCNFETQIWLEIITSRDAKSVCFKGSQTSCTETISDFFLARIWPEKTTSRDGCVLLILLFFWYLSLAIVLLLFLVVSRISVRTSE